MAKDDYFTSATSTAAIRETWRKKFQTDQVAAVIDAAGKIKPDAGASGSSCEGVAPNRQQCMPNNCCMGFVNK